jgi:hypothetical protein
VFVAVGYSTSEPDYLNFLFERSDEFKVLPTFAVIPAQQAMFGRSNAGLSGLNIAKVGQYYRIGSIEQYIDLIAIFIYQQ